MFKQMYMALAVILIIPVIIFIDMGFSVKSYVQCEVFGKYYYGSCTAVMDNGQVGMVSGTTFYKPGKINLFVSIDGKIIKAITDIDTFYSIEKGDLVTCSVSTGKLSIYSIIC